MVRASARVVTAPPGAMPNRLAMRPHRRAGRMRPRRDVRGGRRAVVREAETERPDGEREQQQREQR
jgi:hypothetical protein